MLQGHVLGEDPSRDREGCFWVVLRVPWPLFRGALPALQGKDTILNILLLGKRKRRQEGAAAPPRQTLLGSTVWALGTGAGMLYLAAILCLCAWPCVHFIVEIAQHSSMVSIRGSQLCVICLCCHRRVAEGSQIPFYHAICAKLHAVSWL